MSQELTKTIQMVDNGAHGTRRMYVLKGRRGAMVFTVMVDRDFSTKTLPLGIDYHSRVPLNEYQKESEPSQDHCAFLDGAACWCDGSSLAADELWRIYDGTVQGEHAIWSKLLEWYHAHLGTDDNADAGGGI